MTSSKIASSPTSDTSQSPCHDSVFLKACRGEPTERTPVWLMRQAGRYMKEYRAIREKVPFLELCKQKDLCAEVAVHAADKIDADAAILFSDILLIVEPLGFKLEYGKAESPQISSSRDLLQSIKQLPDVDIKSELGFVLDAVRETRKQLKPTLPLIGFSGAPFTLASYIIEGGGSKNFIQTKAMMYSEPNAWHSLMETLSKSIAEYLQGQIDAGVNCIQLFDSWVGCLSPADYRKYVLPHTKSIFDFIGKQVPTIHFGTNTATLLADIRTAGGDVTGVDYRIAIEDAWEILGPEARVQGNLDPVILLSNHEHMMKQTELILDSVKGKPGHIFNLGHGILPKTPVDHVIDLIRHVKSYSKRSAS